jgi:F-type H+-transporting ATPase subunit epsilon
MADTFQLEIVTPEKIVANVPAEEAQIPGKDGYLGILPGHAPLISELGVGEITYRSGGASHHLAVAWGFAEVLPDKVTILAETCERSNEIDVGRAESAKQRAEWELSRNDADVNYAQAAADLLRAETRIDVAQKSK